jgi:CYTH domain-containing protein
MPQSRRFLVAAALARLILREREGVQVIDGYFPERADRNLLVRLEEHGGGLLLVTPGSEAVRADIPRSQAEALLPVAAGQVAYVRSPLSGDGPDLVLVQVLRPGPLSLVVASFADAEAAEAFEVPAWLGPEVSADPAYEPRRLALDGLPGGPEIEVTDPALHSLLDRLNDPARPEPDVAWGHGGGHRAAAFASPADGAPDEDKNIDEAESEIEDQVIRDLAQALRRHSPTT